MSNNPESLLNDPDPLSSVLSQLKLNAEVYKDGDYCGAWAVDTSGSRRMPFHLIGLGEAWLHIDDQPAQLLAPGDLVLFPHDGRHIVANSSERPPADLINADVQADQGPSTNVICGFFEFQNRAVWPLLDTLAPVVVMDLSDRSTSSAIRGLVNLMIAELQTRSAGFYAVIDHLAYLLFVQVLRQQIQLEKIDSGLLGALFDPKISKALKAIHNHPDQRWTLESLAGEAAMGRSSFAQRFNTLAGMPPMQYLTEWRMQQAKNLLETTGLSVAHIAGQCGYESDAAFRKAFKKTMGVPPGEVRR
jgi:AraC family transcriptional activator of mtrCDE